MGFVSSHLSLFALQVIQPAPETQSQPSHSSVDYRHTIATFGLLPFGDAVGFGELWIVLFLGQLVGTSDGLFFSGGVGVGVIV